MTEELSGSTPKPRAISQDSDVTAFPSTRPVIGYQEQFDNFLLRVGKRKIRSLVDTELQRGGLERLAKSAGLGFFKKTNRITAESFYKIVEEFDIYNDREEAAGLIKLIPVGQSYVANFNGSELKITRPDADTYVFSR